MLVDCSLYTSTPLPNTITHLKNLGFNLYPNTCFRHEEISRNHVHDILCNPLKSDIPVQGYGGFYGELLLKLSQFLSERHRNYTPRNLAPFSFQIYTV